MSAVLLFLAAAVPAGAVPLAISGRLVGAGGHGISRAVVELVPLAGAAGSPPPVATAASDASGRFRLEAPEPGMWKVLARAEGYVPLEMELAPLVEPRDLPPANLSRRLYARHSALQASGTRT